VVNSMKLTQIIVSRREGLTISREELSVLVESYFWGLYLEFRKRDSAFSANNS